MRWLLVLAVLFGVGVCFAEYTADWESLEKRPLPGWFDDAKIGIFIHWGVYSVPAYGCNNYSAEWYWFRLKGRVEPCYAEFHERAYGKSFTYADFAPMFTAVEFDPDEWAELFEKSGAKYVVFTSKHHDGFCNWPSAQSWTWNSVSTGPHRDLVGLLTAAVRKTSMRMGLYYSLLEWFNPQLLSDQANKGATQNYVDSIMLPQLRDIVNTYLPEIIFSDGDWNMNETYYKSKEFLAWLYNESPVKNTVVVNDRWGVGNHCNHGGYFSCNDRFNPGKLFTRKYENAMTIDRHSWGFNRNSKTVASFLSEEEIIYQIASTVSTGGNILINVGPTEDGRIDPIFQERLSYMGRWLELNGRAIYATKPWRVQNDTEKGDVWYTQSKNNSSIYAIVCAEWPLRGLLILRHPKPAGIPVVSTSMLLGFGHVSWRHAPNELSIQLPSFTATRLQRPHGYVIQLTGFI